MTIFRYKQCQHTGNLIVNDTVTLDGGGGLSEKSQKANVSQYELIFGYKRVSGRGRLPVSKMFNKFDQLGPSPIFPVSAVQ